MKHNKNMVLFSGLALFSMFFGAGNLIFPPILGLQSGTSVLSAIIGFSISGVGFVMLGVISVTKAGGTIESVSEKLGKVFTIIFSTAIILAIGPGLAIPRTSATTYEIIKLSILPNLNPVVSAVVFFAIVLFFVLRPSDIIDNLGKILTPALLFVLALIIIKGIMTPLGPLVDVNTTDIFSTSLREGYQTMDLLAALVFTYIVVQSFGQKGITDKKELVSMTIKSSVVACFFLILVYGGLIYVGASASALGLEQLGRTELLVYIVDHLLGTTGKMALSIAMALACLTTAIGLTATVGEFFQRLFKSKIDYKIFVIIAVIFSAFFSVKGVASIITISVPILLILYPVSIVLVVLQLFNNVFQKRATYIGAVTGALLYSIFEFFELIPPMNIPTILSSFLWIVPAVVLGGIFTLIGEKK